MATRTSSRPPSRTVRPEAPAVRSTWGGRLWKRLGREARRLLPAWLFFFLSFSLLRLTQTAVLQEFGVTVLPASKVLAGSLIVAKALMTVDAVKLFARFEGRPILITAICKTFLYMLVVFFFEYGDVIFEFRHQGFTAGSEEFARRLGSMRFWVIQVWLVVLLFLFSATRTLRQRLGRGRFRRLFVGH